MSRVAPQSRTLPDGVVEEFVAASRERAAEAERETARQTCLLLAAMCDPPLCDMDALYRLASER